MKQTFFITILLLVISNTFSQTHKDTMKVEKKFKVNPWENVNGFRVAPSYYKNFELEISYLITSYPKKDPGFGGFINLVHYIGAGIEYVNVGNQNAIGAKLSYEANFSILSAQIGGDIITSNKDIQYRIMPRIGLSAFGIVTIYYGWNYNLIKNSELLPSEHLLTLQINILKH